MKNAREAHFILMKHQSFSQEQDLSLFVGKRIAVISRAKWQK